MVVGGNVPAVLLLASAVCVVAAGCQQPAYEVRYEINTTPSVVENEPPEDGPRTSEIAAEMTWNLTSAALELRVSNRADTTAMIVWKDATVAYDGGEPDPLLCGSPAANPDLPQEPTAIPRRGQVVLDAIPESAAEWEWLPNRVMGGSWRASRDIMGVEAPEGATEEELLAAARSAVGHRLMVRVPVRIGSRLLIHSYDMRVKGAATYRAYH
jgi:hypothetical protein